MTKCAYFRAFTLSQQRSAGNRRSGCYRLFYSRRRLYCSRQRNSERKCCESDAIESCYAVIGQFNLIIKVTVGSERKAVFWGNGYITRSQTDAIIDTSQTIPSLDELLAQIAATEAAAKAANTAATNANSATEAAQAATTNANKATKAASAAATNANTATKATQTATTNANNATEAANKAAGKIDNMTVQVSGLEAGATPTANLELVDGHYNLSLPFPREIKATRVRLAQPRKLLSKLLLARRAHKQASPKVAQQRTQLLR